MGGKKQAQRTKGNTKVVFTDRSVVFGVVRVEFFLCSSTLSSILLSNRVL